MSIKNLVPFRQYISDHCGKIELATTNREEYRPTNILSIFDQRFNIADASTKIIIDSTVDEFEIRIVGSVLHISESLFDHTGVSIRLTDEFSDSDIEYLFDPEVFPTLTYLKNRSHFIIDIEQSLKQPIFINISSDYEVLAASVLLINILPGAHVEIVEEINSRAAIISTMNYIVAEDASLRLFTHYNNTKSGSSYMYRLVATKESADFVHSSLTIGSASLVDETRIVLRESSAAYVYGAGYTDSTNYHKIISVEPETETTVHTAVIDLANIKIRGGVYSVSPVMVNAEPSPTSSVQVDELDLDDLDESEISSVAHEYIGDILDTVHKLTSNYASERFENFVQRFSNLIAN